VLTGLTSTVYQPAHLRSGRRASVSVPANIFLSSRNNRNISAAGKPFDSSSHCFSSFAGAGMRAATAIASITVLHQERGSYFQGAGWGERESHGGACARCARARIGSLRRHARDQYECVIPQKRKKIRRNQATANRRSGTGRLPPCHGMSLKPESVQCRH